MLATKGTIHMIDEEMVSRYCYGDISCIENYDEAVADTEQTWHCHHRVETIMNCGKKELISKGCYYERPSHELIFLTPFEHRRLNMLGKHHTEETRSKISDAMKGKHHTEYTKKVLSEFMQSRVGKLNPVFGTHWYTDGKVCVMRLTCPPGFRPGRLN